MIVCLYNVLYKSVCFTNSFLQMKLFQVANLVLLTVILTAQFMVGYGIVGGEDEEEIFEQSK